MALSPEEREYQRLYKQRIRQAFVDSRGGACEWCGDDPGAYGLVVDYADLSTKTRWAANIWGMAKARRDAELEKCIVLCRACYLKHTEPEHGTLERARKFNDWCKCPLCKPVANAYARSRHAIRGDHVSKRVGPRMMDEPYRDALRAYPIEAPKVPTGGWWNDLGRDDTLAPGAPTDSDPNDSAAP